VALDNVGDVLIGSPAPRRTLAVTVEGAGSGTVTGAGISCPSSCSSSELNGANLVLTGSPNAGFGFAGWSGACTGMGLCDLTMNSDATATAHFAAKPVGPPAGGGTGSGGGHVAVGGTASGSGNATTPSRAATTASVTVAGRIVALPTGVGMPLRCWAKAGTCPTTTLTLSIVETFRGKQVVAIAAGHASKLRKMRVVVGKTTVTLKAGQMATVNVMLNRIGRAQLNRRHRLSALLQISSQTGAVVWNQTVGLFQKTKRK